MHLDHRGGQSRRLPPWFVASFSLLLATGLLLGPMVGTASAGPVLDGMAGNGTASDPYVITNVTELQAMEEDLDGHYVLGNDLDASGFDFRSIGGSFTDGFTGTLDGSGHTISGLTIHEGGQDHVGLVSYLGRGGEVRDVRLEDVDVRGDEFVGGLAGAVQSGTDITPRGTVSGTSVVGNVSGGDSVGGLVGENQGTVSGSYVAGSVNGSNDVGGVVGTNFGTVAGSYATADVRGTDIVGGLIGGNSVGGEVTRAHATGDVSGDDGVGGLIGENNDGTVAESYATGDVSGDVVVGGLVGRNIFDTVRMSFATGDVGGNELVGGLVGSNSGTVDESFAVGAATGDVAVGGLAGRNGFGGTVTESYATGDTRGNGSVGGLAGENFGTVSESYAASSVDGVSLVGGLVGDDEHRFGDGTVSGSYWDMEATGQSTSAGGTGLTTSELTGAPARSNASSFGFGGTWVATDGYPHLRWAVSGQSVALAEPTIEVGSSTSATVTLDVIDGSTVTATGTSTYGSDDETIATVSADGVVTGVGNGTATIAATLVGTATALITVKSTNAPPTAALSAPDSVVEGRSVPLDASDSSDPENDTLAYAWDLDDDGDFDDGSDVSVDTSFVDDGDHVVRVRVVDDEGASDTAAANVTVSNAAPSVSMELNGSTGPDPVSLSATFTDRGTADTHTATVDWGDGTTAPVAVDEDAGNGSLMATLDYATGGTYSVTLTVTDDDGGATTVTGSVTAAHLVAVDVKPGNGDETDPINAKGNGVVPVAIFTTDGFDATTVAVSSLRLGESGTLDGDEGATAAHDGHEEDVDGDGDTDLVVHFRGDTGLTRGDTDARVVGETTGGVPLAGTDAVRLVGGKRGGNGVDDADGRGNENGGGKGKSKGKGNGR